MVVVVVMAVNTVVDHLDQPFFEKQLLLDGHFCKHYSVAHVKKKTACGQRRCCCVRAETVLLRAGRDDVAACGQRRCCCVRAETVLLRVMLRIVVHHKTNVSHDHMRQPVHTRAKLVVCCTCGCVGLAANTVCWRDCGSIPHMLPMSHCSGHMLPMSHCSRRRLCVVSGSQHVPQLLPDPTM